MNTFEQELRRNARRGVVGAANAAVVWDDHPSYNTKSAVLMGLRKSDAVLAAVAEADGMLGARYVVGIDRNYLAAIIEAVKTSTRGHRIGGLGMLVGHMVSGGAATDPTSN